MATTIPIANQTNLPMILEGIYGLKITHKSRWLELKLVKIIDWSVLLLVGIFVFGFIATEYKTFGMKEPIFEMSAELQEFFKFLIWPIIALLVIDLAIKYRQTKDPKKFVKKYWIDIVMLILIPIFSAFKLLKLGVSIIKKLKTAKMGTKIIHKTKKMSKK